MDYEATITAANWKRHFEAAHKRAVYLREACDRLGFKRNPHGTERDDLDAWSKGLAKELDALRGFEATHFPLPPGENSNIELTWEPAS